MLVIFSDISGAGGVRFFVLKEVFVLVESVH